MRGIINEELSADGITEGPTKVVKRGKPKRRRIERSGGEKHKEKCYDY